jgi:hypothetical protein
LEFLLSIVNHIRIDSLLSSPRFADREQHPIRIEILGDSSAEGRCRLLSAPHIILNHSLMEYIKILDFETGTAASRWFGVLSVGVGRGPVAFVESQRCSVSHEFRPTGRFELQRNTNDVAIKRH